MKTTVVLCPSLQIFYQLIQRVEALHKQVIRLDALNIISSTTAVASYRANRDALEVEVQIYAALVERLKLPMSPHSTPEAFVPVLNELDRFVLELQG